MRSSIARSIMRAPRWSVNIFPVPCYRAGMADFWKKLKKPIYALAPMEDVTDAAFRKLIAQYGAPSVMFTEFTSADGLVRADEAGQMQLRKKLMYSESERPIVAQLFSSKPEYMERAAKIVSELGFNGIDINMGCPVDEVVRQGCGAALIENPTLARALIDAARRGSCRCESEACTSKECLPVSVKTRLGYNTDSLEVWLPELLQAKPSAITIHARTRKEMSKVPARWERIARAVEIRDAHGSETLILGNGDVKDMADAQRKVAETACDGVMLGRAIYGNPWLFAGEQRERSPRERIDALVRHLQYFDELLSGKTSFNIMKKHFKAYVSGWDGAKDLRIRLMETQSVKEALAILE